ncbi:MAG: AEC family transporter [Geminicoccaceae bacterium]|nr:MAG: AEC family transporter [Geminicoccaceae bacterium]
MPASARRRAKRSAARSVVMVGAPPGARSPSRKSAMAKGRLYGRGEVGKARGLLAPWDPRATATPPLHWKVAAAITGRACPARDRCGSGVPKGAKSPLGLSSRPFRNEAPSLFSIVDAILPLVLLCLLGTGLRIVGFLDGGRRAALDAIVYFVLVPPLILVELNRSPLDLAVILPLMAGVLVPIGLIMGLIFAVHAAARPDDPWLDGPGFAATVMGLTRNNIFIVFAASQALLGSEAAALTAIAAMVYVPTVNVIGVLVCMRYGRGGATSIYATLKALSSNPFIVATAIGILLNVTGIGLPGPIGDAAELLSRSAVGLALVCVGAALTLPAARRAPFGLVATAGLKLLVMPALAAGLAVLAGLEALVALTLILYHAGPTAPGAYVLARQLGGDADLMAAAITLQTVLAAVTIPLVFTLATQFLA